MSSDPNIDITDALEIRKDASGTKINLDITNDHIVDYFITQQVSKAENLLRDLRGQVKKLDSSIAEYRKRIEDSLNRIASKQIEADQKAAAAFKSSTFGISAEYEFDLRGISPSNKSFQLDRNIVIKQDGKSKLTLGLDAVEFKMTKNIINMYEKIDTFESQRAELKSRIIDVMKVADPWQSGMVNKLRSIANSVIASNAIDGSERGREILDQLELAFDFDADGVKQLPGS